MTGEAVTLVVLGILGGFLLILITRALWCWYFKINEMVELLTDIRGLLSKRQATAGSELPDEVEITPEMIEAKFGRPGDEKQGS